MRIIDQSANVLIPESPMKHIEKIGRICYKSEDKTGDDTDKKFVMMLYKHQHHAMLEHYRFIMQVNPTIYGMLESVNHPYVQMTNGEYGKSNRFVISLNARALINLVEDSHAEDHGVLPMAIESIKDELIGHIVRKYDCHELFGRRRDIPTIVSTAVEFIENSPKAMSTREWMTHGWASVHMITDRGVTHEVVRHRPASYAQESTRYCNYSQDKFGNEITVIDQGFTSNEHFMWEEAMYTSERMYNNLIKLKVKPQMARSVLPTCLKTEIVMTTIMQEWEHFFDLRMRGTTGAPHPMIKKLSEIAYASIREVFFHDTYKN